jgi:hypothetical protein
MAEDRIEVTHLMGKKLDKPIIMKWKSETKKNKMEQVAAMFGKELGKRFTVNFYNRLFDVAFDKSGLRVFSDEIFEDELSRLLLEGLIIGNVVIVDD